MANIKNFQPDMDPAERLWFDACPKAVLFEICRQFGMRIADDFTAEGAFQAMQQEWSALHSNGIVPQKPLDVAKAQGKIDAYLSRRDAFRELHPNGVRLGDLMK